MNSGAPRNWNRIISIMLRARTYCGEWTARTKLCRNIGGQSP